MAGSAANSKPGLVVVDVQNDFVEGGALAVQGGTSIVNTINKLLGLPFAVRIATRDSHPKDHISFASNHTDAKPFETIITISNPNNSEETENIPVWPDHCVQGTTGHELVEKLDKARLTHTVDKGQDARVESYSAFGPPFRNPRLAEAESSLKKMLEDAGVNEVYVCGLATDYCVKHTALDAVKEGFHTTVIQDAVKAIDSSPEGKAALEKEFSDCGVASITSQELFEKVKSSSI